MHAVQCQGEALQLSGCHLSVGRGRLYQVTPAMARGCLLNARVSMLNNTRRTMARSRKWTFRIVIYEGGIDRLGSNQFLTYDQESKRSTMSK